jgi:HK97 family phage major capsid protein
MGADWMGPGGEGPPYDEAPPLDRPAGMRPAGMRPAGMRPAGMRPAGMRPAGMRPAGMRPAGMRPAGMRPAGMRPAGMRPYEEQSDGLLDPDEWSADIAELFCACSAVVRLGARVALDQSDLRLLAVDPIEGISRYSDPLATTDPGKAAAPALAARAAQAPATLKRFDLKPRDRELAESSEVASAIKQDIARALAFRADQAFFHGNGKLGVPLGIASTFEVGAGTADVDLLKLVRSMVTTLRHGRQAVFGCPGWVLHPRTLESLVQLRTTTGLVEDPNGRSLDATRLLEYDGSDGGALLGYPFIVSAATRAGNVTRIFLASDWSEAWIGADGNLVTVDVAPQAQFRSDETVMRAVMHHDFVLRRPRYFTYGIA